MSVLKQFDLTGKTALVTGCKRGIGKAMAIGLAEAGADIIGVSATLESSGSEVEQAVKALGRSFKGYACDFADRDALYAFITEVKADFPVVDILVNNAGTIKRNPAAEHSDEYWDHVIDVNLSAQFILSREFGKEMVARGAGKVIFTASLLTFQGGITVPGYAASKGGVGQLTKALANEWAGNGRAGQRHRAGLHPHGQHPGAAGQPGTQQVDPRTHPGRPLGRSCGLQRPGRLPGFVRIGLCQRRDPRRRRWLDGAIAADKFRRKAFSPQIHTDKELIFTDDLMMSRVF